MKVTPVLLPHQQIQLKVHINQDQLSGMDFNGSPAIQTQQLMTQAVVQSGHSLVLGGINQSLNGQVHRTIPIIGHIPVIGWLLSSHQHKHSRKQLLVIITPKKVQV